MKERSVRTSDIQLLIDQAGAYWEEHPEHPVADWKHKITEEDTRQGYWEWVAGNINQAVLEAGNSEFEYSVRHPDIQAMIEENGAYWEDHPDHELSDWKYEVFNDDTKQGYWEWAAGNENQAVYEAQNAKGSSPS